MEPQDDKKLWDLLGRLPAPVLSPFFARNVLRRIRQERTNIERVRNLFTAWRLIGGSAIAAIIIGLALVTHHPGSQPASSSDSDVVAGIDPQDYEVVADLDALIAWDENSVWEEQPTL